MAVEFTNEGGSVSRFYSNATLIQLNDGRKVQAAALQNGDVWLARSPGPGDSHWATINSVPVVT